MTNPDSNSMDVLSGLLEERRRYEGWLAQLEARRASTPPHVFEKVKGDYDHRLRAVLEQLGGRAAELEESLRSFEATAASLLSEENARRDERAEAELRAAVGEYTPEEAQDLLARTDEAINRFATERAGVVAELQRLREILAQVQPPSAPAAEVAPAPANPTPPAGPVQSGAFDELAFLQSVVEPRRAQPTPAPNTQSAGLAGPAGAQVPSARPADARPRHAAADGTPAFLKGMPTEQAKTLKCQECGTMNYATEWYCERCGGELAAM